MTKTNYKLIAKKRLANLEKEYEELKIKKLVIAIGLTVLTVQNMSNFLGTIIPLVC